MPPPTPESEKKPGRLTYPYTRMAVEWIAVAGFAGIVAAILGIAAAFVFWAWTA